MLAAVSEQWKILRSLGRIKSDVVSKGMFCNHKAVRTIVFYPVLPMHCALHMMLPPSIQPVQHVCTI